MAGEEPQRRPPERPSPEPFGGRQHGWERRPVVDGGTPSVAGREARVEPVAQGTKLAEQLTTPGGQCLRLVVDAVEIAEELLPPHVQLHPVGPGDPGGEPHEAEVQMVRTVAPRADGHRQVLLAEGTPRASHVGNGLGAPEEESARVGAAAP